MELSIIILNWNAADDTIRCVNPLSTWQQLRPVIWVVDNNSVDNSADLIAAECPHVHLIRNPTNLGFAGGTNQGIKASLARDDQPILLLNNDASIGEADVIRLLKTLHENPDFGAVGPLLFEAEKKDRLLSAGGKNPVLHHQTRVMRFSCD
ncbi:MAG: glycosyltransferase, partial [Gammaproteobacteria bacterium]|nr:glycosyltransferase [Gammaproteobacteria bacterium]